MDTARVKSYAKLNLTLHITGVADGYHMLDSLVTTVDLFDLIKVRKRRDNLVHITMHGRGSELIAPEDNNAYKAAERYIERYGTKGVDITVYKNIPMQAGLGGSSADAAGVLNAMSRIYPQEDIGGIYELANSLGSDTAYMLDGGYARLSGRGDVVSPIESKLKLYYLLLLPPKGVRTADCYRLSDAYNHSGNSDGAVSALLDNDLRGLGNQFQNDLYPAAKYINPDIEAAVRELREFDPLGVCMTGSGSGVFAAFENADFRDYAITRYSGKFKMYALKTK